MLSFEKYFEEMVSTMDCKDDVVFQQMIPMLKMVFEAGWSSRGAHDATAKAVRMHIDNIFQKD